MMKSENGVFQTTVPRPTVEVLLPDGRILCGPRNRPLASFLNKLPEWNSHDPIMGAVVNGELRELTRPVELDSRVRLVRMSDPDGSGIYRRSITFLLEAAFEDTFPAADISVDHSLSSGGFYCSVINRAPLSKEELAAVEARMKELVKADLPFERQVVPLPDAISYFQSKGQHEKVQLLQVPHQGHLGALQTRRPLRLPPRLHGALYRLPALVCPHAHERRFCPPFPAPPRPKRVAAARRLQEAAWPRSARYNDWLVRLGIKSVGALNSAIEAKRASELILISEALHEHRIAEIARFVMQRSKEARIVLVAGPSSSGKTTFSKRLTVQLLAQGISPFPLELDNYFLDREHTPKDEKGQYEFESLGALDTARLQADLQRLIAGEEVQLPKFNFPLGRSEPGEVVKLDKDQLVILEGIHGLNPRLLPGLSRRETTRIYVSCLTQLNLDRHNRISTTDTRLLRRIIRDARDRGYTAQQTISHWDAVGRGEKKHIFPYQENADEMFNSALVYELSAIRMMAEPLLRQVVFGTPEYIEAKRLLAFLQWFLPIGEDLIPDNSILREFIGGSILKGFTLWQNGKHRTDYGSTGVLSELNC